MAKDQELSWQKIDVETLTPELRGAYEAYKVQQRAAAEAKSVFERAVIAQAGLPNGHTFVFSYRFGQLSMALTEGEVKTKALPKNTLSLGDFLKAQASAGRKA